jgi:hypothetical protein
MSETLDISIAACARARRTGGAGELIAPLKWTDQALHRLADMIGANETKADIAAWFGTTPQAIWTAVSRHNISPSGFWRACANCGGAYMTDSKFIRRCEPCKD